MADVWDFETTGLYWWRDKPYGLAVLIDDQPYFFVGRTLDVAMRWMRIAARQLDRTLIAYNAKFDLHFAFQSEMPDVRCRVIDPSVALFLIDENRFTGSGKGGLKSAVRDLFGYQMLEFEEVLGRVSEPTGEFKSRKCKLCGGKGWRGRGHDPCENATPGDSPCTELRPVIRSRQRRIDEVPLEDLAEYAGDDVWWTKRVWEWCEKQLSHHSVLRSNFYEVQMPLLVSLLQAEHRGVAIDLPAVHRLRAGYLDRIEEIDDRIRVLCGITVEGDTSIDDEQPDSPRDVPPMPDGGDRVRINLGSPAQVDWFLFSFLGLRRPPFRAKRKAKDGSKVASKWQTDEHCLLWLAKHAEHEVPKLLWERRKLAKYVGTYLDNILSSVITTYSNSIVVHTVYPNFNQTSARTGRLSSSRPLNFQNIPRLKEFRSLFIARPDHVLVIADAKQIELRFLAHFSNEPALVEAYKDPSRDLHQETADFLALPGKDGRYVAKTANFAEVYEVFGTTFAMQLFRDTEGELDWTPKQAQAVLDRIRESRPAVRRWKQAVVTTLKEHGYIKTVEGRYRRLPGIHNAEWGLQKYAERQGINARIQGSVADLFARLLTDLRIRATLILQVHDEVVCEVPAPDALDLASYIKAQIESFTDRYQTRVPILADVGIGPDWSSKA